MSAATEWAACFSGGGRTVCVGSNVMTTWRAHRQSKAKSLESCGVLVGCTSVDKTKVWIETVTTPMALDIRSRTQFVLRDPGHQIFVEASHELSHGTQIYLGTWHTHPTSKARPSNFDFSDWRKCLRRNIGRPLVFVVVGIDELGVYIQGGRKFKALERMRGTFNGW